jgi:hypoxanthine phosphoribosyltransferase
MQNPLPYLRGAEIYFDQDMTNSLLTILTARIKAEFSNCILVAIAHDGIPAAHFISRRLDLRVYTVNSPAELDLLYNDPNRTSPIVLIDDMYDTGRTYDVYTAALTRTTNPFDEIYWHFLVAKQTPPPSTFAACVIPTQAYIRFPWEIYDAEDCFMADVNG